MTIRRIAYISAFVFVLWTMYFESVAELSRSRILLQAGVK